MAAPRTTYFALRDHGIFDSWPDLEAQLPGLENPVFKAFRTLSAAEAFMAGWDDNSSSSPFGYAGPSTLPPTPTSKLGRVGRDGQREESREERKRKKKNFAAPSRQAAPVVSAGNGDLTPSAFGPSPFAASTSALGGSPSDEAFSQSARPALRNAQSMPLLTDLQPPPVLLSPPAGSPSLGGRRRSPLIQSVVEEEEDEATADPDVLSPPPSSESEGHSFEAARSRASSISASSVEKGRRKSGFGLGLGGVFSSASNSAAKLPLSPPSSPERKGSFASSIAGEDNASADDATLKFGRFSIRRKSSAPSMTRDDASSIRSSAFSVKSTSDSTASTRPRQRSMWDDPALLASSTPKPGKGNTSPPTPPVPLKGTMRPPSFSSRPLEPPVRPRLDPSHHSSGSVDSARSFNGVSGANSGSTSPAAAADPLSPFASQAPVFSRRESAGSSIILPVKSTTAPGSSSSSIRRLSSANSLSRGADGARVRDSLHRFSFGGSATSLSSLSVLEPPPKVLSSRFSYSSSRSGSPLSTPLQSPSASVESFSDALTHISTSTPRTSPDAVEEPAQRESMFEDAELPVAPGGRDKDNGRVSARDKASPKTSPAAPASQGGWKKVMRRMKSALSGGDDATSKKAKASTRA